MTALALGVAALVAVGGYLLASRLGSDAQPRTETRLEQVGDRIVVVAGAAGQHRGRLGPGRPEQHAASGCSSPSAPRSCRPPALAWLAAGRLLRPVQHLTEVVERVEGPGTAERAGTGGPDELGALADGLDRMLDRLEEQPAGSRSVAPRGRPRAADAARPSPPPTSSSPGAARRWPTTPPAGSTPRAAPWSAWAARSTSSPRHGRLALGHRRPTGATGSGVRPAAAAFDLAAEAAALAAEHEPGRARGPQHPPPATGPSQLLVPGDASRLRTAAGNLLSNAVRLAPTGSTVTVGLGRARRVGLARRPRRGPGLAAADHAQGVRALLARALRRRPGPPEPPRRPRTSRVGSASPSPARSSRPVGARITVASAEGVGSTFVVWLPMTSEAETDAVVAPDGDPPRGRPVRGPQRATGRRSPRARLTPALHPFRTFAPMPVAPDQTTPTERRKPPRRSLAPPPGQPAGRRPAAHTGPRQPDRVRGRQRRAAMARAPNRSPLPLTRHRASAARACSSPPPSARW